MELFISLITAFLNIILGLFTFLKNPNSTTHRLLAFLTLLFAFWAVTNYISLNSASAESTLFWIRIVMFSGAFMGPTIFLLMRAYPNHKISLPLPLHIGIWVFAAITGAAALSPYMFTSVTYKPPVIQPHPGPAIALFAISFIGFLLLTIISIIRKYIRAFGIEKIQLRFLLFGIAITFTLITITNFILVNIFNMSAFVVLGPFYTLIFVSTISYTIVKHKFLDINLAVARTVSFILVITLFIAYYAFLFSVLGAYFTGSPIASRTIIISTALAIIMALSFPSFRHIIEIATDKVFYKNKYNTSALLYSLARIMAGTIKLEDLAHGLLQDIIKEMRIENGVIILFDEKNNKISQVFSEGNNVGKEFDTEKILKLLHSKKTLVFDELEEGELKNIMRELRFTFVAQLQTHSSNNGIFALGTKRSGEIYTPEDVNVLEIFTSEAAVAVQNALSFDEIQRFNVTLKDEVDKATESFKAINEEVYKKNIELKQVTDELAGANSKLKQLDHLKDEFVSLASHELRTPMTAIKSYLWLFLQYNQAKLDPKEKLYIERAYEATDRLIMLVNDMLNVSRIESGRMNLVFKPADIVNLTKEVFEELAPTAQKQKVNLELQQSSDNLPQATADQNKIREVLTNLIGNSLKFTDSGGKVMVKIGLENDMLVIHVADTGKGIKQEDMQKLFQKFGTVNNNYLQKQNTQGTGLGLYISKSIVELHGGKIWVESEGENKGTTFSFSLKIDKPGQSETNNSQTNSA